MRSSAESSNNSPPSKDEWATCTYRLSCCHAGSKSSHTQSSSASAASTTCGSRWNSNEANYKLRPQCCTVLRTSCLLGLWPSNKNNGEPERKTSPELTPPCSNDPAGQPTGTPRHFPHILPRTSTRLPQEPPAWQPSSGSVNGLMHKDPPSHAHVAPFADILTRIKT